MLPAVRCDLFSGALPWVAAQDAQGNTRDSCGGYGMGLAFPKHDEIVDLAYRPPAKGLAVDTGGLIEGAPGEPGDPRYLCLAVS